MPYRPPDEVVNLVLRKDSEYFVRIGHGKGASPELYSSGPGYLLSAGGVSRGMRSSIVARPICLFLNDSAKELSEVFHIKGKSMDFKDWNNTGVYKDFACSNGPVHVPESFTKLSGNDLWSIYGFEDLRILVHSTKNLGILAIFKGIETEQLAMSVYSLNSDAEQLKKSFVFPEAYRIGYDVEASKRLWVIRDIDGKPVDRNFTDWPLLKGL